MSLARARLREFLGHLPDSAPLDALVEERTELDGGLIRELVSYQVEPGERIRAYVFVPRGATRTRAIWCIHQHAGQFDLGKSEPAGLAGNPQQHYALELARRGYITMVADQLCFEERREPRLDGQLFERFEFTRRISAGSTLQAKYSSDNWRGLDYLQGRPRSTRTASVASATPSAASSLSFWRPSTSASKWAPRAVVSPPWPQSFATASITTTRSIFLA